jgi:hypothetical protein
MCVHDTHNSAADIGTNSIKVGKQNEDGLRLAMLPLLRGQDDD